MYSASKVAAECAISKWLKENEPLLVVNYSAYHATRERIDNLSPYCNIGPLLSSAKQGYPTSGRWVKALWDGNYDTLKGDPPKDYVNVQDARLHVIALVNPAVQNEGIFAVAVPVSIPEIAGVLRKLYPQWKWENYPEDG